MLASLLPSHFMTAIQTVLAAVNTLVKGLEMQFRFQARADAMSDPVNKAQELLIACNGHLVTPTSLSDAQRFREQCEEILRAMCVHINMTELENKPWFNTYDPALNQALEQSVKKVLDPEAND